MSQTCIFALHWKCDTPELYSYMDWTSKELGLKGLREEVLSQGVEDENTLQVMHTNLRVIYQSYVQRAWNEVVCIIAALTMEIYAYRKITATLHLRILQHSIVTFPLWHIIRQNVWQ